MAPYTLQPTHGLLGGGRHLVKIAALAWPARPPRSSTKPCPSVTLSESTTRTGRDPSRALAACRAASMVADIFDDRLTHTTPSAPSAAMASNAAWNCPGEGADVSGSPSKLRHRDQNSLVDSSTRSTSSSVAEPDPQRDQADAKLGQQIVRQVAGAVGHHTDARHVPPWSSDSGTSPGRCLLDRAGQPIVTGAHGAWPGWLGPRTPGPASRRILDHGRVGDRPLASPLRRDRPARARPAAVSGRRSLESAVRCHLALRPREPAPADGPAGRAGVTDPPDPEGDDRQHDQDHAHPRYRRAAHRVCRVCAISCDPSGVHSGDLSGNTPDDRVSTGTLSVVFWVVRVRSHTSLVGVGTRHFPFGGEKSWKISRSLLSRSSTRACTRGGQHRQGDGTPGGGEGDRRRVGQRDQAGDLGDGGLRSGGGGSGAGLR